METNFLYKLIKNSESRSVLKTITWRVFASIITGIIIFLYTGEIKESGVITITVAIVLTVFYYLHERFWVWLKKQKSSYFRE